MKVLVLDEKDKFLEIKGNYDKIAKRLQVVLGAYLNLGLPALSIGEFSQLFTNLELTILNKMTNGQDVVLMGFKVKKEKAFEFIEKPRGYEALVNAVNKALVDFNQLYSIGIRTNGFSFVASQIEGIFEITNNNVKVRKSAINEAEERFKHYAETGEAIEVNSFVNDVIEAYKKYNIANKIQVSNGFFAFLQNVIEHDHSSNQKGIKARVGGILEYNG